MSEWVNEWMNKWWLNRWMYVDDFHEDAGSESYIVKFRSRRTGSVIDWKIDWPNDLLNAPISTFWVGKSAPEAKIFKI